MLNDEKFNLFWTAKASCGRENVSYLLAFSVTRGSDWDAAGIERRKAKNIIKLKARGPLNN